MGRGGGVEVGGAEGLRSTDRVKNHSKVSVKYSFSKEK